jgi:hypothetical protein
LALGLGLGLGLKHHPSGSELVDTKATNSSWKRDPQDYILGSFDTTSSNTTRSLTLNLTEIPDGAPDGVARRLLLINGQFPGPVIEANEGDRLVVQVNNFMAIPSAIHWHGQYQNGTITFLRLTKAPISWTELTGLHNVRFNRMVRSRITSLCSNSAHTGTMLTTRQPIKMACLALSLFMVAMSLIIMSPETLY